MEYDYIGEYPEYKKLQEALCMAIAALNNNLLARAEAAEQERDNYRKMLEDIKSCSYCAHYQSNWTPECIECSKNTKIYRPKFELREK